MPFKNSKPVVSILCVTYNQENFLAEALDSFLNQNVDFSYEIIIHDDASSDGTKQIIKQYEKKHPGIIRPMYERQNRFSQNDFSFVSEMFKKARGKYIAQCEGDDFWTDPHKLQRQVDFLESNKDYALVFHPVRVLFQNKEEPDSIYPQVTNDTVFDADSLIKSNFIQSNSVVYRRQKYDELNTNVMPGDWYLHLYHAQYGKVGYIDEVMAAYRRHSAGIWWETYNKRDEVWKKYGIAHVALYFELIKMYGEDRERRVAIMTHITEMMRIFLRIDHTYGTSLLKECVDRFPEQSGTLLKIISPFLEEAYQAKEQLKIENEAYKKYLAEAKNEIAQIKSSKKYRYAQKAADVKNRLRLK